MSDYTKTTNFTAKDSLASGDANKLIKGSEHDTEYDAIATAIATKLDGVTLAGEVGTVTLDNTTTTLTTSTSTELVFAGEVNGSAGSTLAKIDIGVTVATNGSEETQMDFIVLRGGSEQTMMQMFGNTDVNDSRISVQSVFQLLSLTTAQIGSLDNIEGGIVYDTTTNTVKFNNGSSWANI